jgi:nitrate reductase beta subunit
MKRREHGEEEVLSGREMLTETQMLAMYKLLGLSKYNDRFVIPTDVDVSREDRIGMQQHQGFRCPTGGCHR